MRRLFHHYQSVFPAVNRRFFCLASALDAALDRKARGACVAAKEPSSSFLGRLSSRQALSSVLEGEFRRRSAHVTKCLPVSATPAPSGAPNNGEVGVGHRRSGQDGTLTLDLQRLAEAMMPPTAEHSQSASSDGDALLRALVLLSRSPLLQTVSDLQVAIRASEECEAFTAFLGLSGLSASGSSAELLPVLTSMTLVCSDAILRAPSPFAAANSRSTSPSTMPMMAGDQGSLSDHHHGSNGGGAVVAMLQALAGIEVCKTSLLKIDFRMSDDASGMVKGSLTKGAVVIGDVAEALCCWLRACPLLTSLRIHAPALDDHMSSDQLEAVVIAISSVATTLEVFELPHMSRLFAACVSLPAARRRTEEAPSVSCLAQMGALTAVDVSGCDLSSVDLSGAFVASLRTARGSWRALYRLEMQNCRLSATSVASFGMTAEERQCDENGGTTNLRVLTLDGNPAFDDTCCFYLFGSPMPSLRTLSLRHAKQLNPAGLAHIIAALHCSTDLETLRLHHCPKVGNEGIAVVAQTCVRWPALRELDLTRCGMTFLGLHALAPALSELCALEKLILSRNHLRPPDAASTAAHLRKNVLPGIASLSTLSINVRSNRRGAEETPNDDLALLVARYFENPPARGDSAVGIRPARSIHGGGTMDACLFASPLSPTATADDGTSTVAKGKSATVARPPLPQHDQRLQASLSDAEITTIATGVGRAPFSRLAVSLEALRRSLTHVDLSDCGLTSDVLAVLFGSTPSLDESEGTKFADISSGGGLQALVNLKYLAIGGNRVTAAMLAACLEGHQGAGTYVGEGSGIAPTHSMNGGCWPVLEQLLLDGSTGLQDEGCARIIAAVARAQCPMLRTLSLALCGAGPQTLAACLLSTVEKTASIQSTNNTSAVLSLPQALETLYIQTMLAVAPPLALSTRESTSSALLVERIAQAVIAHASSRRNLCVVLSGHTTNPTQATRSLAAEHPGRIYV